MIAVDTNVVVRLLTQDDELQYQRSLALFEVNEIFIPDTVVLESEWVLRFAYNFQPNEICMAFRMLLGLPNVHVGHEQAIAQALNWHELGLDFADALHLAQSQTCTDLYTFDAKFARRAESLSDCNVQQL